MKKNKQSAEYKKAYYKKRLEEDKNYNKQGGLKKFWPNLSGKEAFKKYSEMLVKQEYKCGICRKPETILSTNGKVKNLAVDHCHKTNIVRGLLCERCNRAIGLLRDNYKNCLSASMYLRKIR
jgi:hypothetical protein